MQQLRLSAMETRVFTAVNALEARGETPYPSAIEREAGLPEEQVRLALHSLTEEKNLLHREESALGEMDLGPRWCVRQPT